VREQAFALYANDWMLSQISEKLDVPLKTIARWSWKGGWKKRLEAMRKEAGRAVAIPSAPGRADSNLSFSEKQAHFRDKFASVAARVADVVAAMPDSELVRNADKIKSLHATGQKALDLEKASPRVIVNVGLLARAIVDQPRTTNAVLIEDDRNVPATEALTHGEDTGCDPATAPTNAATDAAPPPDAEG
jgi:putative ATPase subunit gpP of terminase